MSEPTDKAISRLELLAKGPAELRAMAAEIVETYTAKTVERLSANEETSAIAGKVGGTLVVLGTSFLEAIVTEKIHVVEKTRAETIKALHEGNKAEAEAQKAIEDKEVSRATAERLQAEAMKDRIEAIKMAVEIMEKHANPIVNDLVRRALFDAGTMNGNPTFSLGVDGRELGQPVGGHLEGAAKEEPSPG